MVWNVGSFLDITALGCHNYLLRLKTLGVGAVWQQAEKRGEMMPETTLKHCHCVWKYPGFSYWVFSSSYFLLICYI